MVSYNYGYFVRTVLEKTRIFKCLIVLLFLKDFNNLVNGMKIRERSVSECRHFKGFCIPSAVPERKGFFCFRNLKSTFFLLFARLCWYILYV